MRSPSSDEVPPEVVRYRLRVEGNACTPPANMYGLLVLASILAPEVCADTELLQVDHDQHTMVEPDFPWIKNPAAISQVSFEKPEGIAASAMLTVVGLLVYAAVQGVSHTPLNVAYTR